MKKAKVITILTAIIFAFTITACANGNSDHTPEITTTGGTDLPMMSFGMWPQSEISESVTVDESVSTAMGAYTYYMGSNGAWYAKLNDKYFKVEPIRWRVISYNFDHDMNPSTPGKKLIITDRVLINSAFYDARDCDTRTINGETIYSNNYKYSKIRAYLNGLSHRRIDMYSGIDTTEDYSGISFLETAFTLEEQNQIAVTTVDNSAASTNPYGYPTYWNNGVNDYTCENTADKLFILSEKEFTTPEYGFDECDKYIGDGITTSSTRIFKATAFAIENRTNHNSKSDEGSFCWLRSPIADATQVREVYSNGRTDYGYRSSATNVGVLPALCID